jgi:hypothetical protein
LVNIEISLTGENGDKLVFDDSTFILERGFRGLGIPTPVVRIDKGASDGGVFRFAKRDIRQLDLPIVILGSVEENLRRLAKILRGKVTLTATFQTGEAFQLECYFNGGADTEFGDNASDSFCRWVIELQAPQPYWTSTIPQTFSVSAATEARGLLSAPSGTTKTLSALRVKSSQALGSVPIENLGDIASPIIWQINGPATSVTIDLAGIGFAYTSAIANGETVIIDTEAGTVKDPSGVNMYGGLDLAPKFFSIPAGSSVVSIVADGADSNTKISGFFSPRREVLH